MGILIATDSRTTRAPPPPPPPHYKKLTTIFLLLWIKHINVKGKKFVPAVRGWYELGGDILVNLLPSFGQEPRRR